MGIVKSKLVDTICNGIKSYYAISAVDECASGSLDVDTLTAMSQRYMLWFNKVGVKAVYSCSSGVVSDAIVENPPYTFDALLSADAVCIDWALNHYRGAISVNDNCVVGKTMQEVYDNCFTQLMAVY